MTQTYYTLRVIFKFYRMYVPKAPPAAAYPKDSSDGNSTSSLIYCTSGITAGQASPVTVEELSAIRPSTYKKLTEIILKNLTLIYESNKEKERLFLIVQEWVPSNGCTISYLLFIDRVMGVTSPYQ